MCYNIFRILKHSYSFSFDAVISLAVNLPFDVIQAKYAFLMRDIPRMPRLGHQTYSWHNFKTVSFPPFCIKTFLSRPQVLNNEAFMGS